MTIDEFIKNFQAIDKAKGGSGTFSSANSTPSYLDSKAPAPSQYRSTYTAPAPSQYKTTTSSSATNISETQKLQDQLVREGYMSQAEVDTGYGIYGPKTTAAMQRKTSGQPPKYAPVSSTSGNQSGPSFTDEEANSAVAEHPRVKTYTKAGNTPESIQYAIESGDISGLKNEYGQPFTDKEQKAALDQASADTKDYYAALKQKDTADAESALADKQAAYQDYLLTSGQNFEADKGTLDQTAANQGVLFSGGRKQKEQNLQRGYEQDQATKQRTLTSDIGNTARDYQYAYGGDAAKGLSNYYKAGSNTYNPNVATGGVSSGGLSSIYRPGDYNFGAGTVAGQSSTINKQNATRLLTNRANKLLSTGYNNQL